MFKQKRIERQLKEISETLRVQNETQNVLSAKALINQNRQNVKNILENIHLAEFKVFSQWGDDGIIQFLVDYLDIKTKTFIEFGVSNYYEANTRFLLMNNNWTGVVMDSSQSNIDTITNSEIYWKYSFKAVHAFITCENINKLISDNYAGKELGILHIDIDGNDYWVWDSITAVSPVIVILEYNSVFGNKHSWTVPYKPDFDRMEQHFSGLYFGASIPAFCDLAETKGYAFIGCNSSGNNAYFVKKEYLKDLKPLDAETGYVESKFRESRDNAGEKTFLDGANRLTALKGMEVFNTRTQKMETI